MMAVEHHLRLGKLLPAGFNKTAPGQGIPHLGAPQGIEIMQIAGHQFRATESALFGQVKNELRGRLTTRDNLEHKLDTIDGVTFHLIHHSE